MWQALRISKKTSSDFELSANELAQRTTQRLIMATGGLYLLWHLVVGLVFPGDLGWDIWVVSPVVFVSCGLALFLLTRRLLLAQVIWQVGLAAAITLAVAFFREPRVALLYALLPLMAVITIGWPAGVLTELGLAALVWGVSRSWLSGEWFLRDGLQILAGGAFTGFLGWAASDSLLTVTLWSLVSFAEARANMEEARQNRGQLARVLKDLDQAYYRLQRANAALVVAWKTAAEAERFRAEFATNVSHELRTPLNLIVGFSEMMMTSPESYGQAPLPGPYRSDLNAIYHSAQHLLALVDDVIDMARIDAGRIALAREEVDLGLLVREATAMVRDYIAAKGLELRVLLPDALPTLWLDRLRIRQVLLNLLVNAARFTERGSISVQVLPQEREVLVRVTDTGQGIPPQNLPRIFEEFHPSEESNEPPSAWHSGSGLGLPISKRFVELHHGRMGVESTYTQGTTIWFTLPGTPSGTAATPASAPTLQLARPQPVARHGASERIVVLVHPDSHVAPFLQRHMDGYRMVGAPTLAEGLALAQELRPVALLLDSAEATPAPTPAPGATLADGLPGPANVPVLHCPLPSSRQAAQSLGVRELLSKPVSREELLAAIDRLEQPVRRVLIADDDPEVVRLFQRMLSTRLPQQDCLEAYNGEEVLHVLHTEPVDLLFLDLVMPHMDGQEVLRRMAADPQLAALPVIAISAKGPEQVAMQVPANLHIARQEPLRMAEMLRLLDAILNAFSPQWG